MRNSLFPAPWQFSFRSSILLFAAFLGGCGSGYSGSGVGGHSKGPYTISGTVVDYSSQKPIAGALVFLESAGSDGADRPVAKTTSATDGTFLFDNLSSSSYDIVANAMLTYGGTTSTYANTMTLAVPSGTDAGKIPLFPEYGVNVPTGTPVTIEGVVSSTGASGAVSVDAALSPLQGSLTASLQGKFTIPIFAGSTERVTTGAASFCAGGNDCIAYQLFVPASMPSMGTYSPSGTQYSIPPQDTVEVLYVIEGDAFVVGTSTPDCLPSRQYAQPVVPIGTLGSANPSIGFVTCQ